MCLPNTEILAVSIAIQLILVLTGLVSSYLTGSGSSSRYYALHILAERFASLRQTRRPVDARPS